MAQCSLCKFELFASRVLCVAKHDPAFIAHGRNTGVQASADTGVYGRAGANFRSPPQFLNGAGRLIMRDGRRSATAVPNTYRCGRA